jgi:hypothetical protein
MKKLVKVSILFGIAALLMLMVFGSAAAEIEPELEPVGEGEVEAEPEVAEPVEEEPDGTAVRIDFEIAGHAAKRGHYSVQALGGGEIASWYALDGWEDSGWIEEVDIGNRTVWVEVVYYPGPDTEGTVMTILNHVPDEAYGWVSDGMAHALEVAWPDEPLMGAEEMDPNL